MGSVRHPRIFNRDEVEVLRTAFHEIYEAVRGQNVFLPDFANEDELKAEIIRRLLDLASNGTPPQHLKSKVLSSLPLR